MMLYSMNIVIQTPCQDTGIFEMSFIAVMRLDLARVDIA